MIILELLRVVDNNGNDTNEILEREELHNRGKLHNEVTIYIINNKKEVLLQRRSKNRRFCPNMLGVIAGHVSYNETPLVCAGREVKEEVGVDLLPEKGQVILSDIKKIEFGKVVNKIVDVWLFEYDGEVDLSNATTDEVAQVAWMDRRQIRELFDANMFVDTLEYFFTEVDK